MSGKRGELAREILDTVPEGRLNAVVLHMMRERDIPLPGADGKVLTIADFKEQIARFVESLNVRDVNLRRELEKSAKPHKGSVIYRRPLELG